jgi:hypothetical protein
VLKQKEPNPVHIGKQEKTSVQRMGRKNDKATEWPLARYNTEENRFINRFHQRPWDEGESRGRVRGR